MSSSNNPIQHHAHSDQEPLPSKAPFDYSAQTMERAKLPKSEEGDSASKGGNHDEHCSSELHRKEPVAHQKIPTAEGHHFFNEENPRPKPVDPNEREKVEWFEGQKDPAV
ncbi:hypothetical protein NMY22_g17484 [Coprinellus aureogranulatus]|nr:hypothetical protein NMY22_g17484 [Coprinellus aureogranulatus]